MKVYEVYSWMEESQYLIGDGAAWFFSDESYRTYKEGLVNYQLNNDIYFPLCSSQRNMSETEGIDLYAAWRYLRGLP